MFPTEVSSKGLRDRVLIPNSLSFLSLCTRATLGSDLSISASVGVRYTSTALIIVSLLPTGIPFEVRSLTKLF